MLALGLVPKKTSAIQEIPGKRPAAVHNCTSEEARKAAAAALSAVREVTSASASTGKVEVSTKHLKLYFNVKSYFSIRFLTWLIFGTNLLETRPEGWVAKTWYLS